MAVDLQQVALYKWQLKNFPGDKTSTELLALGIQEEAGELAHMVLKRKQGIREGVTLSLEKLKAEIADAIGDLFVYGICLLGHEGLDAEQVVTETIAKVLKRDWVKDPTGATT